MRRAPTHASSSCVAAVAPARPAAAARTRLRRRRPPRRSTTLAVDDDDHGAARHRHLRVHPRRDARRRGRRRPAPASTCRTATRTRSRVIDPATFQVIDSYRGRDAPPARRAVVRPAHALRHEQQRQHADPDRSDAPASPARRSPSRTRTTSTSLPTARTALVMAERDQQVDFRNPTTWELVRQRRGAARRREPRRLHRRRHHDARELRVLGLGRAHRPRDTPDHRRGAGRRRADRRARRHPTAPCSTWRTT